MQYKWVLKFLGSRQFPFGRVVVDQHEKRDEV
jgi:hypothetical protein